MLKTFALTGGLVLLTAGCSDDEPTPVADSGPGDAATDSTVETDGPAPTACKLNASATPIKIGGIFTLTSGGSASTQAANKDQIDLIKSEVNGGCGTTGDAKEGTPIDVVVKDGQDNATLTPGLTADLIDTEKVAVMVGAGGSSPTVPSARDAVKAGIPYGIYFGTTDSLSGCSQAQLDDSAITKSEDPVFATDSCWDHKGLVLRTASLSTVWGRTAAKYVKESFASKTKAAAIYRDDSFGRPIKDDFKTGFENNGGTVSDLVPYAQGTNKDGFKPLIKTLVQGDPEIVLGVWRIGELKAFLEAYVELGADGTWTTKPAGYDQIQFVNAGSVRTDYKDLSSAALGVMATRAVGLEPYWDPDSTGFKRWMAAFTDFDPAAKATVHTQMRTYDALMVLMLAMVKANSTDGAKIKAELAAVANPPGQEIYPGEFKKARALLFEGKDINYQGASGAVDLADTGNIKVTPYQVWKTKADGASELVKAYDSAE